MRSSFEGVAFVNHVDHFVLADPLDMLPAVILGFAVLNWVAGFDII